MQASTTSALPTAGAIDIDIIIYGVYKLLQIAAVLWFLVGWTTAIQCLPASRGQQSL